MDAPTRVAARRFVEQSVAGARPPRITPARPRRWLLAVAAAAATGVVLLSHVSAPPALTVALTLLATIGSLELSRREAEKPGDPRPIVLSIAGLFTLAVVLPPRFATDIWSYTMIGRTVVAHHANPYRVAPVALASDPLLHLLHQTWRTGTTPYGPLFVLHASFIALVAGTHPLLYRLAFQLTAAAAVGTALWLLWRETRSTAALALVGLNPVVAGSIVNAGHNDALVALGLLGAVLCLKRGRTSAAGWLFCAAVLVKLSVGFAMLPLAVWVFSRYGKRGLVRFLAPTVLVAVPVTVLVPGALHSTTNANGGVVTRLSLWNIPLRVPLLGLSDHLSVIFAGATMLVVALVVLGSVIGRRQPDPGRGATLGVAAWLVGAAYVLAWYTALGLIVAALRPSDRLARWFAVQGGVITAAFLIPRTDLISMPFLGHLVWFYIPAALGAGLVWAVVPLVAPGRRAPLAATLDHQPS